MLGYLLGAGLKGIGLVSLVFLILGLVALIRCRKEDIPAIVRSLASWWRRKLVRRRLAKRCAETRLAIGVSVRLV